MTPSQAQIDLDTRSGVWAHMKIRNESTQPVRVHNPRTEAATDGWEHSKEAYQAAVLRSYGFLQVALRDDEGSQVEPLPVHARAGHIVALPLELPPGGELDIPVPLDELYRLQPNSEYDLTLTYGDETGRYLATTRFLTPG
jgi:hypothetical protein